MIIDLRVYPVWMEQIQAFLHLHYITTSGPSNVRVLEELAFIWKYWDM